MRDEIAARLVDRINDIQREFPVAVDLGANTGNIVKQLSGHGGIKKLFMVEGCRERLFRDEAEWSKRSDLEVVPVHMDESCASSTGRLPFRDGEVDMVLSSLSMHWVNDLPALLAEVRRVLRPDGVFLAAMLGGDTLQELRSAFVAGQSEREGGVSPHVSPLAGVADVGNLLAGAGFGIPTVDADSVRVEYPHALRLAEHLQGMGEGNAATHRRFGGRRDTMLAMAAAYHTLYTPAAAREAEAAAAAARGVAPPPSHADGDADADADEGVSATFEVIYMIGWAPAPAQPKALRRGSVPKGFAARGSGPQEPAAGGDAAGDLPVPAAKPTPLA